jgi:hypothetical protein
MGWTAFAKDGLNRFTYSSPTWEVEVIPDLGAKISSICWRGVELLAHNPRKPLRAARYAAPYAEFDASAFDECFPTIGPCTYPEHPWTGTELPDHGEVWALPWSASIELEALQMQVHGVRLPYVLSRRISFPGEDQLLLQYQLSNPSSFPVHYLWSSHPLFALQPGMRILLPAGASVQVDWSKDARLGERGQAHLWPLTTDSAGNPVDLSLIQGPETCLVDKLYSSRLLEGWCALYDPASCRYAAFLFSTAEVPYVGLSINLGGWPVDDEAGGYYNLGLEPCSGYPDRLDLAVQNDSNSTLPGRQTVQWEIRLQAGEAPDAESARQRLQFQPAVYQE